MYKIILAVFTGIYSISAVSAPSLPENKANPGSGIESKAESKIAGKSESTITEETARLRKKAEELENLIEEQKKITSLLEDKIAAQEDRLQNQLERLTTLQETAAGQEGRIADLESKLNSLSDSQPSEEEIRIPAGEEYSTNEQESGFHKSGQNSETAPEAG